MAIKQTLEDSKARLDALLEFANNATGESDANIGDAIKTLVDGFGQGGGADLHPYIKESYATHILYDTDTVGNNVSVDFDMENDPDLVIIVPINPTVKVRSLYGKVVFRTDSIGIPLAYTGGLRSLEYYTMYNTSILYQTELTASKMDKTGLLFSTIVYAGSCINLIGGVTYKVLALALDYTKVQDGHGGGSGDTQLPGKTVVIDGACEIYVGDLGDYGYGVRIDPENVGIGYPMMCHWNPTRGLTLTYLRNDNTPGTGNYHSYWDYYPDEHKFKYNGATTANYNMRGTWQFIPYTVD